MISQAPELQQGGLRGLCNHDSRQDRRITILTGRPPFYGCVEQSAKETGGSRKLPNPYCRHSQNQGFGTIHLPPFPFARSSKYDRSIDIWTKIRGGRPKSKPGNRRRDRALELKLFWSCQELGASACATRFLTWYNPLHRTL